jgi:ribonuclease HII
MQFLSPDYELQLINHGYSRVIGIDEVGRGCWAGPVAIGIYIFDKFTKAIDGVTDSKKLSPKRRSEIYINLCEHNYNIEYAEAREIDMAGGVTKTIEKLIAGAVKKYYNGSTKFLIDGQFSRNFGEHTQKIVRGDATYYSIAAASILAKVERDALMAKFDKMYSGYGFARHKGYGTREHQEALKTYGYCAIHRKSYKPVMQYL